MKNAENNSTPNAAPKVVLETKVFSDGTVDSKSNMPEFVNMLANGTESVSVNVERIVSIIAFALVAIRSKVVEAELQMNTVEADRKNELTTRQTDELKKKFDKLKDRFGVVTDEVERLEFQKEIVARELEELKKAKASE